MTAAVIRGDARSLPLPDASIDLIVTSPPYWGLRDYRDGDASLAGQIGNEPTPHAYVEALWECAREWMRVLKPEGSLWINLGDKYSDRADGGPSSARSGRGDHAYVLPPGRSTTGIAPRKSLLGLPWRYAIGCIDQLGLILRAEVIWAKPNGMPESVTDRVRRSHEHWFHLVKQPHYYSAVDEIREPHIGRHGGGRSLAAGITGVHSGGKAQTGLDSRAHHPLGALPGSVWEIATQPLRVPDYLAVDHFAAFPMEWPRRIMLGWSPAGVCTECGEGRRPVTERAAVNGHDWAQAQQFDRMGQEMPNRRTPSALGYRAEARDARITGYACACPEPSANTRPALVLDPFGGTGTTALIADLFGRHGISIDRSADYCRIARWRTADPGERARALEVPKPPPVPDGQAALFGEGA